MFTVLETGRSKIRVLAWLPSGEKPLPGSVSAFALCPHTLEAVSDLFYKALIPFMRAPLSRLKYLPKFPPPRTIPLEVVISAYEFVGDTNIQTTADTKNGGEDGN